MSWLDRSLLSALSRIVIATVDEHDDKNPGAARTRHRSEIREAAARQ
jgi:hypothetical protein